MRKRLTAEEALAISEKFHSEQEMLSCICGLIFAAANKGYNYLDYRKYLSIYQIHLLKDLGYSITNINKDYNFISWSNPTA